MTKFAKCTVFFLLAALFSASAFAMVEIKKEKNMTKEELRVTSFLDYPPFGNYANPPYRETFDSVFRSLIEEYAPKHNFELAYVINKNYPVLVRDVRRGEIDVLLGMYHETKIYNGLEYIFPAVVNNPLVVIMLPGRIHEVSTKSDLKKLRGVMNAHEHISDYVAGELKSYNIKKFDKSVDVYEQLFTGKADYVLGSLYFNMIETSKLGLRSKVSFSKQALWNMPMFIGVSKLSRNKKMLIKTLEALMEKPETRTNINNRLRDMVMQAEKDYIGVVPPAYTKK